MANFWNVDNKDFLNCRFNLLVFDTSHFDWRLKYLYLLEFVFHPSSSSFSFSSFSFFSSSLGYFILCRIRICRKFDPIANHNTHHTWSSYNENHLYDLNSSSSIQFNRVKRAGEVTEEGRMYKFGIFFLLVIVLRSGSLCCHYQSFVCAREFSFYFSSTSEYRARRSRICIPSIQI